MVFLVFVALARSLFPRFLFFLSGMAVLFLVRGLGVVAESITPRGRTNRSRVVALVTALGALMIVAASVPGLVRNYRIPKQNFSGAVRFLDEAEANGARIVVASACGTFREYFERSNWTCVANGEQLRAIRTHTSQRTLVVATLPVFLQPSLRERLRDDSTVVQRFPGTLGGGTIVVYEVRPVG
jgi:hypothetical protein